MMLQVGEDLAWIGGVCDAGWRTQDGDTIISEVASAGEYSV